MCLTCGTVKSIPTLKFKTIHLYFYCLLIVEGTNFQNSLVPSRDYCVEQHHQETNNGGLTKAAICPDLMVSQLVPHFQDCSAERNETGQLVMIKHE